MTLKFVIDMNLSVDWIPTLHLQGYHGIHWSAVGNTTATDVEIMAWALQNGHIVFTHDLDFGTLLANTSALGPSVVLLRGQDVRPARIGQMVINALTQTAEELGKGALVVVELKGHRVRVLPL